VFAVIDVETTGGHLYDDRITEIAIYVSDGTKLIKSFSSLVNPERKITPFVVKLTGISDEMVSTAPTFAIIAKEVLEHIEPHIFVAHNIGFDYSMVKREFKRIGIPFRATGVCTVQLSQRVFKNQASYSLGNLCQNLGITLNNRHRAFGDAEATAFLLHKIVEEKGLDYIVEHSNAYTQNIEFEGAVNQKMIDDLPEEPGIFRFLNDKNEILFIRASKNIFGEVSKFLLTEVYTSKFKDLFKSIASIDYSVYNSLIISELQEIEEIRKIKPLYNKSSITKDYPVGIYENKNLQQAAFVVERSSDNKSLWRFNNEKKAYSFLKKLSRENKIHPPGFPNNEGVINNYRELVEEVLVKDLYPMRNFFIIREVGFASTIYAIYVEDFCFRGFAEIDKEFYDGTLESLKESLKPCENNPFSQKALQRYLRKKKTVKIIPC
jgi:DNA polymerase III subunit epsilon